MRGDVLGDSLRKCQAIGGAKPGWKARGGRIHTSQIRVPDHVLSSMSCSIPLNNRARRCYSCLAVPSCLEALVPQHPPAARAIAGEPIIYIVDDDESMREALRRLFGSVGFKVEMFASAAELLRTKLSDVASCLVLDVRLPGLSGLDFQAELAKANIHIPIIFMTGHGDIPMSVRAMKGGAIDFLTKPFRDQDMLDAVVKAIEHDRERREADKIVADLQALLETLTPREREVLAWVSSGRLNKQIAAELGLAEITVKIHRGRIMQKMGARSLADLLRKAETLGVGRIKP